MIQIKVIGFPLAFQNDQDRRIWINGSKVMTILLKTLNLA